MESKLGKLSCAGLTGRMEFETRPGRTVVLKLENRLHPKALFGVVTSRWTVAVKRDEKTIQQTTWNFELTDFGHGAKSALPEQQ